MPQTPHGTVVPLQKRPSPEQRHPSLRLCVVGTGYVGLVSGACLASFGHTVTCIDTNVGRIDALRAGKLPFFEPGLKELVARLQTPVTGAPSGLRFLARMEEGVPHADIVLIAVGTPLADDGEQIDLSQVHAAVEEAVRHMRPDAVLVIKSTAPVGTGDDVQRTVRKLRPDASIAVVSNPEFLREGSAIEDFCHPARVVVGSDSSSASALLQRLYSPLQRRSVPFVMTSRRTAELIKYAANSFLATKLAFINEMADLCERIGADVDDVALGMGLDPRIGAHYLRAGPGYGGSCLPKDLVALSRTAQAHRSPLRIVEAVTALNAQRAGTMVKKIRIACGGTLGGKAIAILGVAFKPDTDDIRAAPALALARALQTAGASVRLSDPQALHQVRSQLPDATCVDDPYECARECDAIVLVTEWQEYLDLDLARLHAASKTPVLIDLRNMVSAQAAHAAGFTYMGLGKSVQPDHAHRPDTAEKASR